MQNEREFFESRTHPEATLDWAVHSDHVRDNFRCVRINERRASEVERQQHSNNRCTYEPEHDPEMPAACRPVESRFRWDEGNLGERSSRIVVLTVTLRFVSHRSVALIKDFGIWQFRFIAA